MVFTNNTQFSRAGANLDLVKFTNATANKSITLRTGSTDGIEYVNNAYNAVIASLSDVGTWWSGGTVTGQTGVYDGANRVYSAGNPPAASVVGAGTFPSGAFTFPGTVTAGGMYMTSAGRAVGQSDPELAFASPYGSRAWSDRVRFSVPVTVEEYNGTTWATSTRYNGNNVRDNILTGRTDAGYLQLTQALPGLRITWDTSLGAAWGGIEHLMLGWRYTGASVGVTITWESSADGTTWTTRGTAVDGSASASWYAMAVGDQAGDGWFRLTVTLNSPGTGTNNILCNFQAFSGRPGDSGGGVQSEWPFTWGGDKSVTFPALITANSDLAVNGVIYGKFSTGAGDVMHVGNDAKLVDINIANTIGVYGLSDATVGGIQLGSSGPTISGANDGSLHIGSVAKIDQYGNITTPNTGAIVAGGTTQQGTLTSYAQSATTVGAVVRGAASQTADLAQFQSNAGTVLAKVRNDGMLQGPGVGAVSGGPYIWFDGNGVRVQSSAATDLPLIVQGAASQSIDLLQVRDSSAATLAWISAGGVIGAGVGSSGFATLHPGDGTHSGYVEFVYPSGNRQGYIGYVGANAAQDQGTINYAAGTHAFSGTVTAPSLYDSGNRVYSAGNPPPYPVTSVAGRTGAVTLTAADIGGGTFPGSYTTAGNVAVGTGSGAGRAVIEPGDATHTGYYEFFSANGNRQGYIGYASTTAAGDTGTIQYVAGAHSFTGSLNTSSTLSENGSRVYSAGNANLASSTPAPIAAAGSVGTGTTYARADHVHSGVSGLTAGVGISLSGSLGTVTITRQALSAADIAAGTFPSTLTMGTGNGLFFNMTSGNPGYVSGSTTTLSLRGGTGGTAIRNNADTASVLTLSDAGALTIASDLSAPNVTAQWGTYTPTITGEGGTNPSGWGDAAGRYLKVGKTVHWSVYLQGNTGFTNGTGTWDITLPFACVNDGRTNRVVGHAFARDGGGVTYNGVCVLTGAAVTTFKVAAGTGYWGAGTWAGIGLNNFWTLGGTYECA
jgi:hypothetical protein